MKIPCMICGYQHETEDRLLKLIGHLSWGCSRCNKKMREDTLKKEPNKKKCKYCGDWLYPDENEENCAKKVSK